MKNKIYKDLTVLEDEVALLEKELQSKKKAIKHILERNLTKADKALIKAKNMEKIAKEQKKKAKIQKELEFIKHLNSNLKKLGFNNINQIDSILMIYYNCKCSFIRDLSSNPDLEVRNERLFDVISKVSSNEKLSDEDIYYYHNIMAKYLNRKINPSNDTEQS